MATDGIRRSRRRHDRRVTIVPPVLHEAELPLAERMAARLDGELFAFGDGHSPIDEVDGPALRLHAVLGARPPRLIAELATAAWVWGARDLPPPASSSASICARGPGRRRRRARRCVRSSSSTAMRSRSAGCA